MTEVEWLACKSPHRILEHLRPWENYRRKLTLYVLASCRRLDMWMHLSLKAPCVALINIVEGHLDGLVGPNAYKSAEQAVMRMTRRDRRAQGQDGPPLWGQWLVDYLSFRRLPEDIPFSVNGREYNLLSDEARQNRESFRKRGVQGMTEEQAAQTQRSYESSITDHATFLHDIFGNPFRPITLNVSWLTSTVLALAQGIYQEKAFDRMPILADALEDAGCDNEDILNHYRQPGGHTRGCWVVDLLTDRK
jgi:hypothetical protein